MNHSTCHSDPQLGIDIHTYLIPPSPVPVPLPTPHISAVLDVFDYLPILGGTIKVNGLMRGTAGTGGFSVHIPVGGSWMPPLKMAQGPQRDDEIFMGSKTVIADGDPFSRIAEPVLDCNMLGMVPPFRPKKMGKPKPLSLELPMALNVAIPNGVKVGGPSTINLMAILMKIGLAGLKKLISSDAAKKLFNKFFPGKDCSNSWFCRVVFGDPVDIRDGSVVVEHQDFILPGRFPLVWDRFYTSSDSLLPLANRVCGPMWETPADIQLSYDPRAQVLVMFQGLVYTVFPAFPEKEGREHGVTELVNGAVVYLTRQGAHSQLTVETKEGVCHHFGYEGAGLPAGPLLIDTLGDLWGNGWRFERQGRRLCRITERDATGRVGRYLQAEWADDRLTALTLHDEQGSGIQTLTRYHYNTPRQLVAEEDATGARRHYGYHQGRMTHHVLRSGLAFHYEWDAQGRVCHSWGDDGLYDYRFVWHAALNEAEVTDSLGRVTRVQFSALMLPVCEIAPDGRCTRYRYDDAGRLVWMVDAARRETRFVWDEAGNLCRLTHPDGSKSETIYNERNRPVTQTDEEGAVVRTVWGSHGELLSHTRETGGTTLYRYNDCGDLRFSMDATGAENSFDHDRLGFLRQHTDAEGAVTHFQHDVRGLLRSRTDAAGHTAQWDYDAKGRLVRWREADGGVQHLAWDASDNLVRHTDTQGGETRLSWSGMGVLTASTTPDGRTVRREYDTEEQLTAVVNARGERYRLLRDGAGRVTETQNYQGQRTQYGYDAGGDLTLITDALGQQRHLSYDRAGRLTARRYRDGEAEHREQFRYDRCGRVTALDNPWRAIRREYDAAGRLTAEYQDGLGFHWQYDARGLCTGRRSDSGHEVEYRYNGRGQMTGITLNGQESTFAYDAAGRLTEETLSPALKRHLRHDAAGRLTAQGVMKGDETLFRTVYRYDTGGNLLSRSDSLQGEDQYQYDPAGRLLSHTSPEGQSSRFLYDAAGDALSLRVHEHDAGPQGMWSEGTHNGSRYLFDRTGNLRCSLSASAGRRDYRWDGSGRLRATRERDGTVEYGYDALGRRVFKRSAQHTTWYWWDGEALAGEVKRRNDETGLPETGPREDKEGIAQRQAAGKGLWDGIREYVYRPGSFVPLALLEGGEARETYFYHNDPNGCPVRLITPEGETVWEAAYHARGRVRKLRHNRVDNPLRFQGQYYDEETGLHYNRHRYYNPESGSYISLDPIGLAGGINLYAYVKNPLNYIDPLGLTGCSVKPGKNFKDHFIRHKGLLEDYLGKKYPKWKVDEGAEFLKDIEILRDTGKLVHVGQGTIKKGQPLMEIYRGEGMTYISKKLTDGLEEFVTLIESGKGMDIGIILSP